MSRADRWVEGYWIPHGHTTPDKYRLRQQVGALNQSGIAQCDRHHSSPKEQLSYTPVSWSKESVTDVALRHSLTPSPPLSFDTGTPRASPVYSDETVDCPTVESTPKSQRDDCTVVDDSLCHHIPVKGSFRPGYGSSINVAHSMRTARFTPTTAGNRSASEQRPWIL